MSTIPKPLQGLTVLAADDSPLNLMIITQVISNAGAVLLTATDGREVLEKLEEAHADIILMDLQMPVLDGFEATTVIRQCGQHYSNIPIIAVTAETDPAEIEKCKNVGMNDFISKPFVPQVIYEKILFLLQTATVKNTVVSTEMAEVEPPAFDLTYLKEITSGNDENLIIIVKNLAENAPLLLNQFTDAAQAEEWGEASNYIHKLKGLVSLFFMPKITEAIAATEKETKTVSPDKIMINNKIEFISSQLQTVIQLIFSNLKING